MQVVFMRQGAFNAEPSRWELQPIVEFHPIGTCKAAMPFLDCNSDAGGPVLVGTVEGEVPFGIWLEFKHAALFKPQFACPHNGVKAWRQARAFKKSFEEEQALRDHLSATTERPRRRAASI